MVQDGGLGEEDIHVVEEGDPVKPGDTLVVAEPFVYAIQPQFKSKVCEFCLAYRDGWGEITLCPECESVGYCSQKCREEDLERHRLECSLVRLRNRKTWPHRAWFVARACLKVQAEGYEVPDKINNKRCRAFGDLVDHYDDITTDSSKDGHGWWYKDVEELLGSLMPDKQEYLSIYGRLLVNSFALRVDNKGEEENIGTALYRACSIFDHSCSPSATTVFTGKKLQIKSMVSSPRMELSNFFISYLDESMTREARRAKLKRTWYFDCGCDACNDEANEKGKHSAVCEAAECDGEVCVDVNSWTWENCDKCGKTLSKTNKFRYQETYEMVRQVVDENGGEIQFTDVSEFLVRQMAGLFHTHDIEHWQAAQGAAQGNYENKVWGKAIMYLELSIPGMRKYYRPYSGYLAPTLEHYAEALFQVDRLEEAKKAMEEARQIMKVVPGDRDYMYLKYSMPKYLKICGKK